MEAAEPPGRVAAAADARQWAPAPPEAFALAACGMAQAPARRIRPDLAIALRVPGRPVQAAKRPRTRRSRAGVVSCRRGLPATDCQPRAPGVRRHERDSADLARPGPGPPRDWMADCEEAGIVGGDAPSGDLPLLSVDALAALPVAACCVDPDTLALLHANAAAGPGAASLVARALGCAGRSDRGAPGRWAFHDDRNDRWFQCTERPVRWPGGRVVRLVLATDVTDALRVVAAQRERAEARTRARLHVEEALARAACHFVSHAEADLEKVLSLLGPPVDACRAYVFRFRDDLRIMDDVAEWVRPGVSPQRPNLQGLESALVPWAMKRLVDGKEILIGDVSALPPDASAERDILEAQGNRASAIVPIRDRDGTLTGFLGCDDTRVARAWSLEDVRALRAVAEMIGAFWDRCETAERLRRAADQLQHARKMEAIGRLAAGIAHDFNNVVAAIAAHTEFALESIDDPALVKDDLREVQTAASRAGDLTRQLLAFGQRQPLRPRPVDLNEVVSGVEPTLRRVIGDAVALETTLAADLWSALLDPDPMEQVIVSLAVHARDAMPNGGALTVRTANVRTDRPVAVVDGDLPPGEYVTVGVDDSGVGIGADDLPHLFEPFYMAKVGARGFGLGLSVVHGIVNQNGGHIAVRTAPGAGTTFDLYFPRAVDPPADVVFDPEMATAPRGTETLVVVEDERPVRSLTARALRRLGYEVLEAEDGLAALELCVERGAPVDLVVTDVVMPRLGGVELGRRLRQAWPGVKLLFVSGCAEPSAARAAAALGAGTVLTKPFGLAALASRVRALLDSPS